VPIDENVPYITSNRFWVGEKSGVKLNPAVENQLNRLRNLPNLTPRSLGPAIERLTELIRRCLCIDPSKRPKARALMLDLQDIVELAKNAASQEISEMGAIDMQNCDTPPQSNAVVPDGSLRSDSEEVVRSRPPAYEFRIEGDEQRPEIRLLDSS